MQASKRSLAAGAGIGRTAVFIGAVLAGGALAAPVRAGVGPTTAASSDAVAPLPVVVPISSPAVRLIGRFSTPSEGAVQCSWSACTVSLRFRGSAANVLLDDGPNGRYEVVVDGRPTSVIKCDGDQHRYRVADHLPPGDHTVELIKCGEPCFGTGTFRGFELPADATPLPAAPPPPHRIEFIGDSIFTGYGNEAHSRQEHFSALTQNAYDTVGAIAARALDADYVCIAWSGKKMWPDNTIPELYDRTLPYDSNSKWDFSRFTPEVVVIGLGSNDLQHDHPPEAGWIQAYEAFVKRVRGHYPQATIYCANNAIMYGEPMVRLERYLQKIVNDLNAAGDQNVHLLKFAPRDGETEGYGADWHPSVQSHYVMARQVEQVIGHDLGWTIKALPDEAAHPVQ